MEPPTGILVLTFQELRPSDAHPPPSETLAQLTLEALGRGQKSRKATQDTSFYDHKQSGKGVAGMDGLCSLLYQSFDEKGWGRIRFPRADLCRHPHRQGQPHL